MKHALQPHETPNKGYTSVISVIVNPMSNRKLFFFFFPPRVRVRSEREERKIEGDLKKSQRACEQLDSQKVEETPVE